MGLCLIAALSVEVVVGILQAALGLGFVIFVHELGHFLVAKMCGVQCDKFMIGFDIGGYKLGRQWGETYYGIGVLPLGGYVKMLGQNDDPSKIAEQMKESQESAEVSHVKTKEVTGPGGEKFHVDKRSYLAKSVPQRMAIISAGVVMNIIFAFIFAFFAFGMGVAYQPCVIPEVAPGSPAYRAGLETGDEFLTIGDRRAPSFDHLRSGVTLGDMEQGVPCVVRKASTGEEVDLTIKPEISGGLARIGVYPPRTTRLHPQKAAFDFTPAANSDLKPGDEILALNSVSVDSYRDLAAILVQQADQSLEVRFRRGGEPAKDDRYGPLVGGEEITVRVAPNQMVRLGLVMTMGPVTSLQEGAPAESAGLRVGDVIESIDGRPIGRADNGEEGWDPITMRYLLVASDKPLKLSIRRGIGADAETLGIESKPREVRWLERPLGDASPMPLPCLGFTHRIGTTIQAVIDGSPADEAGLQAGDRILSAKLIPPKGSDLKLADKPTLFSDNEPNWPAFMETLQDLPDGTEVELNVERAGETFTVKATPRPIEAIYHPDRGFLFAPLQRERIATSFAEQAVLAWDRTAYALTTVFRFLSKLGTQVSVTQLGGIGTIAVAAYSYASLGLASLLLFLTMLSANLAVLNFLPIPVLDGGHMVFLAWEGLTGRPANERVVVSLHAVGFIFLVGLMVFAVGLDVQRFWPW